LGKVLKTVSMVAGIAAIIASGGSLAIFGTAVGASIFGVTAGALTLISLGAGVASTLFMPKPKIPNTQLSRLNIALDPATPRKAVFGTTAMNLDIRYHEASGTDQEYVDYIVALAAHKVTAISEIWLEEKQAWTAAGGVTATYNGYLTVTGRTEGTSANTIAINGGGKWGSSRRLTGCAYLHLRIKRTGNTKKAESPFAGGLPGRVTVVGNGALLYDPRRDSTVVGGSGTHRANDQTTWGVYTDPDDCDNPALQLLWWLLGWKINGKLSIGCGIPANRIDMASFITAANLCDENVTLAIGGTQKRYRTSGTASDADSRMEIINNFLMSMNGTLRDNAGKLTLTVMNNDLANYALDFNEADMLGEFDWQQTRGLTESYNIARGRYVDPSNNSLYQMVDYPQVSLPSPDGIERATTIDLAYVEDGRRAQRIAKQILQRSQYRGMFSATFNAKALGCQVGDVVRLSIEVMGWTNKLFRVTSQEIRFDGQVPLVLVEENAAIYSWVNEDVAPVTPTAPTIYNPLNNPLVLGIEDALLAAGDAQSTADGKIDSYYQASAPTGASEGDYWTDTDDANKLYRYTSGSWVLIRDTGIPTAIAAAAGAQATADGKITTYYSETAPTATAIGDLWYKPSTGFVQRWNGTAWADVATLGATIGENVKDKSGNPVAIEAIRNNLALIDWWKKGATIPWAQNGEYNVILSSSADMAGNPPPPIRGHEDLWFCQEVTGDSEQGGGWGGAPIAPLDPDKAYRFILPIFNRNGNGSAYWGTGGVAELNTTTSADNPYFAYATLPNSDRWYLFVGYIFPRNSTGKTNASAGIWDCKTGTKVFDGFNFCFLPNGGQPVHRAYQFYASNGSQKVFGRPLIEPIESMSDMTFYFEEAARLNNAIGVNASGQFINPVGAGNTTVVANNQIAVNGSGQLAGIGTGNNTVVANTQISINGSGQLAGIGTGNLTEIENSRLDLTFDSSGVGGRVQGILRRSGGATVISTVQLPSAAQNADQLWAQVSGTGRPQDNATVGARTGTNLYRDDGATLLTQADVRTIEGTAAAISNQAATATNSDFAAVTGATKPENNATVGATAGTNLRRSNNTVVSDAQVLNESQQWTQVNSRPLLITGDAITADELLIDPSVWGGTPANWFYLDVDSTGYVEVPAGSGNTLVTNFANATPIDHSATYEAEWEILETGGGAPTSAYYTVVSCWDSAGNLIGQDGTYWYYPSAFVTNVGRGSYERRLARFGKGTARPFPANAAKFGVGVLLNYNAAAVITRARRIRARRIDAENLGVNGDASRWQFANNSAIRWSGGSGWGVSTARSKSALVGAQSVSFDAVASPAMCGFTDVANPSSYNDIDYAWYYADNGALQIYENGNYVWGTSGYTNPDDVRLRIEYDGNLINYYINGSFARSVIAGADRSFRIGIDNFRNGSGFRNINHVSTESKAYVGVNTYNSTGGAWSAENGATIGAIAGTNLRRSNSVVLGDNDIVTNLGTSAAIANQAAWATLSTPVGRISLLSDDGRMRLGAGNGLVDSTNTIWLTDANTITANGTAAAINNQGTLATRNNARLGSEVVDEGGNAIAAEFVRNNVNRGSIGTMPYPSGGSFGVEVNGLTGAIQIVLPNTIGDGLYTMLKFQVDVYNYNTDTTVTYDVSGYVYPANPSWINCTAKAIGGGVGSVKPVRFGRTGSGASAKFCVWIGDVDTVWYYPKVLVRNLLTGYSSIDIAFWQSGWAISTVTTLGAIDFSVLNPTAGDAVFGVNALETWNGAVATLPNFKTIQGTAAAISNQAATATNSDFSAVTGTTKPESNATNDRFFDRRNTNEAPSWYLSNYNVRTAYEFKDAFALGVPGNPGFAGFYGALVTTNDYADFSGGAIKQRFTYGSGVTAGTSYVRTGSGSTWSAWTKDFNGYLRPTFDASDLLETGSTVATVANFKTSQGVASAVLNQGTGATANTLAQLDATAAAQLSSAVAGSAQSVARTSIITKVLNNNASVAIDAASAIFSSGGGATYTLQLKIREVGGTDANVGSAASVFIAASESDYLQVSGTFTNTSGGTRRYEITCALTKVGAGTAVETQSQSYLRA